MDDGLPQLHEPLVVRLRGSQVDMGRQFGDFSARAGGNDAAVGLYVGPPTMAARILAAGFPYRTRAPFERVADVVLGAQRRRMARRRARQFPEYTARTGASMAALGFPDADPSSVFVMDAMQNAVGLVSRTGLFDHHAAMAVPSCSSLAVWGASTVDGSLLHARNFDFPGAAIWDLAPMLAFCEPTEGLRYGFVTTRGIDAPGITCFNEAGLTLTVHTRFHREVRYDRPSVIDLGHEIIRTAACLDDAVAVARRIGAASTWGLLVSSAADRDAVLIETTGDQVAVVRPTKEAGHLSSTNRYVAPELRVGEVTTSSSFALDSDSRIAELEAFVAKHAGGIDADSLEELLGDHGAPGLVDRSDDVVRLSGPSVVSSVSVASIVAEPDRRSVRMSIGRAPSGYGPYLHVPWSWDGPVGPVQDAVDVGPTRGRSHRGEPLDEARRRSSQLASAITQGALDRQPPHVVRAGFQELCHREPGEPGFHTMAAILAVLDDEMDAALHHLDAALDLEATPPLRARLLLLRSRVLHVAGRPADARADRRELAAMTDPLTDEARIAAAAESERPLSRRRLRLMSPDVMLLDLHA
jgi:hypothetical protein